MSSSEELKKAAAMRAIAEVNNGMVLGLGSGTTAAFAIAALGARIAEGLQIVAIPTSEKTALLALQYSIPITSFDAHRRIDLTIDGADEVELKSLNLIKGFGGALLREKIVAKASARMIVIVDESKVVDSLGMHMPLPVEIVPFGWQATFERLQDLGYRPQLRRNPETQFTTENGNYIVDCAMGGIADPAAVEAELAGITGVVESGLFIGLASTIIVGHQNNVEVIEK